MTRVTGHVMAVTTKNGTW